MEFLDDDQSRILRQKVHSWTGKNPLDVEPSAETLERDACELAHGLGRENLMAYAIPRLYGGMRKTVQARDLCVIREELASHAALADVMFGVQALGSHPIIIAGTEEQKKKYLPGLASAESLVTRVPSRRPPPATNVTARNSRRPTAFALTGPARWSSRRTSWWPRR